jgi:hypothetical protein
MMEAVRTSETSVDKHFTRQYNPEDSSEHHTRRRENLKSHNVSHVNAMGTYIILKLIFYLYNRMYFRYVVSNIIFSICMIKA